MKKIILILTLLLMAVLCFGQNAKEMYNKYSDMKGVTAVYVSPAMFRMIGKLPSMDMEAKDGEHLDLTPVVKNLSGFYLLEVEKNTPVADQLSTEIKRMVNGKKFEMLFEAKEDGDVTRLYTAGGQTISSIILTTVDEDSLTFMCLEGNMDRNQLENILAEAAD